MKRFSIIASLLLTAFAFPLTANAICYVNEDAPGVHKEYDRKLKRQVWKTGMGTYLCDVKGSKKISDIDDDALAQGISKEGKEKTGVHKEWDKKSECFVWKDGADNYLGRDKASATSDKSWLKKKERDWLSDSSYSFLKPVEGKKISDNVSGNDNRNDNGDDNGNEEKVKASDFDVDVADRQVKAARIALREAGMGKKYEKLLREIESGLDEYREYRKKGGR